MALLFKLLILISAVWGIAYGGCNQKHVAKPNDVAYITSPGYPGNFTQYVDCYYELYSTSDHPGLLVYVDVIDVTLKCDDDTTYLRVYDGFSRNPRFLGRICEGGQRTFESPKQTLYLTFRSRAQHAERSRGFRLRVRTVPKYCHCYTQETAVLDVTSTPSLLSSPYYPYGTEPNLNCRWLLKAPEDKRVNATLLHADMKGSNDCHNFGLYIYDGKTSYDDKLLAAVCHNSVQTLQSSGPYLLVVFTSGPLVFRSGDGMKLQYSTIPADGTDKQMISQTLFYVITALLILLIFVIIFIAMIKLFLLPKRRKQAERRRRASRARLTRVSHRGSSQSDSASHSESGRHASCSRASSSMSGSSVSSQLSGMSLTRLLSLYGLKKCRQEHRCSSRSGHSPECVYNAQRSGVVIRIPDYSMFEAHGILPGDLPPSYEEAIGHEVIGQEAGGETVTGQRVTGQEATSQEITEQEATPDQNITGQGREGATASEERVRRETLADVIEQAVVAEVMRRTAQEHVTRQSSTELQHQPAAEEGEQVDPSPPTEMTEPTSQTQASGCPSQVRVPDQANQAESLRPHSCEESVHTRSLEVPDGATDGGESTTTVEIFVEPSATASQADDELSVASASTRPCHLPRASSAIDQDSAQPVNHTPDTLSSELAEYEHRTENVSASEDEMDRSAEHLRMEC